MRLTLEHEKEIFKRALLSRRFEERVFNEVKNGNIKIPVYLSAGQEICSATLSVIYDSLGIKPHVFIQHRGHSTYLSFGGSPRALARELKSHNDGCVGGMGGSASIHSLEAQIYGHDGLMGTHVPISVGFSYETKKHVICFVGDAAAEEDYSLTAIGWASTKNLPILFVVEDNNLSILTEKKVRRNWEMSDVGSAMKLRNSKMVNDHTPHNISEALEDLNQPTLLNVNTNRMFWHAGAGKDGETHDSLRALRERMIDNFGSEWVNQQELEVKNIIEKSWA